MKICIIGKNLTSIILAGIFTKKKFNTTIYYNKDSQKNFQTRTLGITQNNLEYLETYFKNLFKNTNPIENINLLIKNGKINKKLSFNHNSENLFNMIKYNSFFNLIFSQIKKNKLINFKTLEKKNELIFLKEKKNFDLIINCEASNALTKNFLKRKIIKNYYNKALTTIIYHKRVQKNNTATQIFTSQGPIAYLPLTNRATSIVFSQETNKKKLILENQFLEIIKKYNTYYKILSFDKVESFDLTLKLPKKYYYKNILFFGDILHSIHPLAGQGFNMTIRDIKKFDEIIKDKISLGLNIDKSTYYEFENETKSYNSIFSIGIDFIHEFFRINKEYVPKKISEKLFTFINQSPKIKKFAIKIANKGII